MKIGPKLTLTFFVIAFTSVLIIGLLSYNRGKVSLQEEAFNRLTAVREMKAGQIEDYFGLINDQIKSFASSPLTVEAMKSFREGYSNIETDMQIKDEDFQASKKRMDNYFKNEFFTRLNRNLNKEISESKDRSYDKKTILLQDIYIASNPNKVGEKHKLSDAGAASKYNDAHRKYHPIIKDFLEKFGYYDIFLVDIETGQIVYSVFKEIDYATSLTSGPFSNTNLSEAFKSAAASSEKGFTKIVDFEAYHPSYNAPASFIATPIYDGDTKTGVLIFQMPIDKINDVMTNKHNWKDVGLGMSGETYIVGQDYTLRTQSRFLIEDSSNYFKMIQEIGTPEPIVKKIKNFKSSIGLQTVKTEGTSDALSGKTDAKIFKDYRGVPVLSAYRPLKIKGMNWVIMSEIDEEEAFMHITSLKNEMIVVLLCLVVLISGASFVISRKITKPIKELTYDAGEFAKGNMDVVINVKGKDEIGQLSLSFWRMQRSIKDLIKDLKEINHNLEEKVIERTKEIQHQKEMVEEKNKEIVDSINYALRLQQAILPTKKAVKEYLPKSFILYKPKDIISGDFYWMHPVLNNDSQEIEAVLYAAVDCTGHGVPGAMVSVVGANSLERCVNESGITQPSAILDKMVELVIDTFETTDHEVKDGMDMALCKYYPKTKRLEYSGANNPLWVYRNAIKEIEEIKADKQPVGKFEFGKAFTNHAIQLEEGDCVYIFTDGYADQFGGPSGKKFKYKTLKDLIVSIQNKEMEEQRDLLDRAFEDWKGDTAQIDDVCIIGMKV